MDGNEFKSRFLPYTNLIYKISFAITKDREDAEDVVQEVYEKLWKSRQSLSEVENDESFIVIMARNMALDRYRYKAKRQTSPLNNIVEVNHEVTHDIIEHKEALSNVEKLLSTLPQTQQLAIRLRHFCDMSILQIADTMEITQENVRQLLSRARRTIKDKMEKIYEN